MIGIASPTHAAFTRQPPRWLKPARWLKVAAVALLCAFGLAVAAQSQDLGHKRPRGVDLTKLGQLTTHEGKRLPAAALSRRPFVVAFGFTHCPDVCPTTLLDLTNHLAALGPRADRIGVMFVTVDPERDTVETLKSYLSSFDPRIVGLTGHPTEIEAAAAALNAFYERIDKPDGTYTMDHTLKVHFFDRYGLLASSVDLIKTPPAKVKELMTRLLAQ